jgi:MtrB/PioB family decaheme-associated outer membrane protein
MRTRPMILIGALLLASTAFAQAQDAQQSPTPAPAATTAAQAPDTSAAPLPSLGSIDFGFRGTSVEGDAARYNRFRDRREGGVIQRFRFAKETDTRVFHAEADNVGYRDQRYAGEFQAIGKLKAEFEWNQIPLFISGNTKTLYTVSKNGIFTIDDAIQQGIQNGTTTLANVIGQAKAFDARSQRDIASFKMIYTAARDLDFKVSVKSAHRDGYNLQSLNFGFSNTIESEVPLNDRTTDVKAALEFANKQGLLSLGYNASWYENQITAYRFDNPLRFTDIVGTPSVGQMSTWPSNTSHSVNVNGSYKLPAKSRATAAISIGTWSQNEPLLPATVNTALVAPVVERPTAEAEARMVSMVYGVNSRPITNLWLNAKYRYYDYDNRTPRFDISSMVVADNTLGAAHETEPSSFQRGTLDLDASFTPFPYAAFNVGYTREDADRTFRIFEKTAEDVFRASVDSTSNRFVTLRGVYERSQRRGSHDDFELLAEVGEHPEMRHFDIADRDRTRTNVILQITPIEILGLNASVGSGSDDYLNSYFGLRDSTSRNYSVGISFVPMSAVDFGVEYGFERYTALQWSRTANPAPAVQFDDPTRDWSIDSRDRVKTIGATLDLVKAMPKTDIRFAYDLSDARATYVYGLPVNQTIFLPGAVQLSQVAPLIHKLAMGRTDVQYFVRPNVTVGAGYWYEQYRVQDFSLNGTTINQLNLPSAILSGYYYRPYTAHSGWLRMTYLW